MYKIFRYLEVPTNKVKKHWSRKQDYLELADQYCYTIYRVNRLYYLRRGQKNEFQEIVTGDQNYCLQNYSGDQKGSRGPWGLC